MLQPHPNNNPPTTKVLFNTAPDKELSAKQACRARQAQGGGAALPLEVTHNLPLRPARAPRAAKSNLVV